VSVIIPARNEEASLGACLQSLIAQTGVAFEIIVVDDHSTDRTREIASSFMQGSFRVIEAGRLPAGWTGKNNAVTVGSRVARGEWLLFTDADTVHLPGSLARALAECRDNKVDMLSYSPEQIAVSFWEMAILPVVFAELAHQYPPSKVSDPASPIAAANGQFILIRRSAYDGIGGHAAVADDLLEDVALARAIKRSGRKLRFRYAADAVRTRMYRDFSQLREGWTKNLALLFPSPARLAALRAIEVILIVSSATIALVSASRQHATPTLVASTLFMFLCILFFRRIRRAHFSWNANLLAIFGQPLFSWLLLRSIKAHAHGSVAWKGRTYSEKGAILATGH
jgi:glycosyltransferase involved in cell wall biosynthesis